MTTPRAPEASKPADASTSPAPRDRAAGLSGAAEKNLREAAAHLQQQRFDEGERALIGVLASAAEHPEALRLLAIVLGQRGRHREALATLERALAQWPDDALLLNELGKVRLRLGDVEAAIDAWRRACAVSPGLFEANIHLGTQLLAQGSVGEARDALQRAVAADPDHAIARVKLADTLVYLGDLAQAAAGYREALRRRPACGPAWWGLASMRTVPFEASEFEQLSALYRAPEGSEPDRVAMGFALAKAYEDRERYSDAFATLCEANAKARRRIDWNAAEFLARVDHLLRIFAPPAAAPGQTSLGQEVIFIVSLPRAGSTLTEQILAAHPDVEGASELSDLGAVIDEESARRGAGFLQWVAQATSSDWSRMGQRYLERTARWRATRPRFTDKMPNNWLYLGAALAMLPGARVIDCRRDALETCWSCFRQLFSSGAVFSYDLNDIAIYYKAYDHAMRHWSRHYPERIRRQDYENLLADPDAQIAELLAFCALPTHPDCLRFNESGRIVRTASAAQVREPLRRDTARAQHYGALLDPLRKALDSATDD